MFTLFVSQHLFRMREYYWYTGTIHALNAPKAGRRTVNINRQRSPPTRPGLHVVRHIMHSLLLLTSRRPRQKSCRLIAAVCVTQRPQLTSLNQGVVRMHLEARRCDGQPTIHSYNNNRRKKYERRS